MFHHIWSNSQITLRIIPNKIIVNFYRYLQGYFAVPLKILILKEQKLQDYSTMLFFFFKMFSYVEKEGKKKRKRRYMISWKESFEKKTRLSRC